MIEINRILCTVDLSEFSRHALDHALALAKWYDAHVTVLHVFGASLPVPLGGMPVGLPVLPPVQSHELAEDVRRFCGPLTAGGGGPVEIVVKEGNPVKEIVLQAERADLVVMSTHGRGDFERLFLGSVTEKVLRTTHVPVLTVPPPVERPESVIYKTILCPVEFSDASIRALAYALSLAEETDARLILLHVVEGWCTPDERVVTGKAYRAILKVAAEDHAEAIVMGVHGKGALNRRLFGSTTHHVIREASCPVLTLRG